jgi:gentisate 1,2-dioxygenase
MSATNATAPPAKRIDEARKAWKDANVTPLWETTAHRPGDAVPKAYFWKWHKLRPLLDDAIECASMQDAERRVLALIHGRRLVPRGPGAGTRGACRARNRALR